MDSPQSPVSLRGVLPGVSFWAMAAPVAARSRQAPPLARLLACVLLLLLEATGVTGVGATAAAATVHPQQLPPQRHERGYCAFYGVCGEKSAALGGGEDQAFALFPPACAMTRQGVPFATPPDTCQ